MNIERKVRKHLKQLGHCHLIGRVGFHYCYLCVCGLITEKKVWTPLKQYGVCCVMVFYVFLCRSVCWFLYGSFCHGALKLDISKLFTPFFLWTSLQFILLSFKVGSGYPEHAYVLFMPCHKCISYILMSMTTSECVYMKSKETSGSFYQATHRTLYKYFPTTGIPLVIRLNYVAGHKGKPT